jgi:hypothetical protein
VIIDRICAYDNEGIWTMKASRGLGMWRGRKRVSSVRGKKDKTNESCQKERDRNERITKDKE